MQQPQLLEYFGKTLEALNGWTVSEAVHPEDRPQAKAAVVQPRPTFKAMSKVPASRSHQSN